MNKKILLFLIIGSTIIIIITLLIINNEEKYNSLIINDTKWQKIINTKKYDNSLTIEWLKFNDNNLIIDEENSLIYYSLGDINNKYNPYVDYKSNNKIAFNKTLDNENVNVIIYNNKTYKTYSLQTSKLPFINIIESTNESIIKIFDNKNQKTIISKVKLKTIKENSEYHFHLIKESIGRNKRDNNLSIFGMVKYDEFVLIKSNDNSKDNIQLFINNKNKGIYKIETNIKRRIKDGEKEKISNIN